MVLIAATQDHAINYLNYRKSILNEPMINSRNIWKNNCSEKRTKYVKLVGYMPGCQDSRQPGTIIRLEFDKI
jgi:hypothetical protein